MEHIKDQADKHNHSHSGHSSEQREAAAATFLKRSWYNQKDSGIQRKWIFEFRIKLAGFLKILENLIARLMTRTGSHVKSALSFAL
jgi:hypothetical protein